MREALGLTQLQFLPRLNAAAKKLGVREYTQSTLSKLETAGQDATFDDAAVYAAVDPDGRGKLWIGWNDVRAADDEPDAVYDESLLVPTTEPPATRRPSGSGATKGRR